MPQGPQTMPREQPSMSRDPKSTKNKYPMMYEDYGGYSLPPPGSYPMGYSSPPMMSHRGFPMSPDMQSMQGEMYSMYGSPGSNSMSQANNKNRMKTLSKSQRENMFREGPKSGGSYQHSETPKPQTMDRMTMDYEGRFIDRRGRIVDYSRNMDSFDGHRDDKFMFNRDMPRGEQGMCDYGMPAYMYGNMMESPDLMLDMDMYGRYPMFYNQYGDDDEEDYDDSMMDNMINVSHGYMDGRYDTDFAGLNYPDRRTMELVGRYGDSFER